MLKKGEFDEELLKAVINNFKLDQYYQQQYPEYAAYLLLNTFVNNIEWGQQVNKIEFQSKLTKQDIVDFCNKNFKDNYVAVYKREGKPNNPKIEKPQITPISTNRDNESAFLTEIKNRPVNPIEPVFLNYSKDMSKLKAKNNIEVLYKQNNTNPLFSLYYVFEMGNNNDKTLGIAFEYMKYLGTSKHSAEEIESELYKLACNFGVSTTNERVYVYVSGLNDNFEKAMDLLEERLAEAVADVETYNNLALDILKKRADSKLDQESNFSALRNYAIWGDKSPNTHILSENELKSMKPEALIEKIKGLKNYEHIIMYYGPLQAEKIVEIINQKHMVADNLQPVPAPETFIQQETNETNVLLANYDAKQIQMAMLHKGGSFEKNIEPTRVLFNTYFGEGMNSIVFQEMREARALAYSAWSGYVNPGKKDRSYYQMAFIGTQSDKMNDAITAFGQILNEMPESEKAFGIAKESVISQIRTERILREDILWNYLYATEFGYETDPRKDVFEQVPSLTLADIKSFQEKYIKEKPYTYCILGEIKDLDMSALKKLGNVKILTQKDIFGY